MKQTILTIRSYVSAHLVYSRFVGVHTTSRKEYLMQNCNPSLVCGF